MINKQLLQQRFTNSAKTYDQYANVQKKMALELLETVKVEAKGAFEAGEPIQILEIGCGTGYLTERLCQGYPNARITAIDLAPGMIDVAHERIQHPNLQFICADIEEMELLKKYDLVISNATFQWFNQIEDTTKKIYTSLKPNGILCFSTFGESTFHELHSSYKKALEEIGDDPSSYTPGQAFYSLEELISICNVSLNGKPNKVEGKEKLEKELFSTVKDFFTSVKKIGANNSNQEQSTQKPTVIKRMIKHYEETYRIEGLVQATYHCLLLKVIKQESN
jgi:malonyl-CoA O-methyltransferase